MLPGPRTDGQQGWDSTVENYSAFEGYLTEETDASEPPNGRIKQSSAPDSELATWLKEQGVRKVVVVGLATDFW